MVPFRLVWSSMVLHEMLDNFVSQHEISHNSIRKLEKNKKTSNSTIYHDKAKDDTRYLLLESMLYHKMARDSSFFVANILILREEKNPAMKSGLISIYFQKRSSSTPYISSF